MIQEISHQLLFAGHEGYLQILNSPLTFRQIIQSV